MRLRSYYLDDLKDITITGNIRSCCRRCKLHCIDSISIAINGRNRCYGRCTVKLCEFDICLVIYIRIVISLTLFISKFSCSLTNYRNRTCLQRSTIECDVAACCAVRSYTTDVNINASCVFIISCNNLAFCISSNRRIRNSCNSFLYTIFRFNDNSIRY